VGKAFFGAIAKFFSGISQQPKMNKIIAIIQKVEFPSVQQNEVPKIWTVKD